MKAHAEEHARNRDAQGRAYRKSIGQEVAEENGMGHTILGDVHYPQPPQKSGGGLKSVLLGAGLTVIGGPIAAAAGMYLYEKFTDEPAPVVQPITGEDTDTDTRVQLKLTKGGK